MNATDAIRISHLAHGLTAREIGPLCGISEIRVFEAGEAIIRHGDNTGDLIVLIDGVANVLTTVGDSIAAIKPGAVVGEIALLDDAPRPQGSPAVFPSRSISGCGLTTHDSLRRRIRSTTDAADAE